MALVHVPQDEMHISNFCDLQRFLEANGILYEQWKLDVELSADVSADEVLMAYSSEIERLKQKGGYTSADVIDVSSQTPNLDNMLSKFSVEHTHADDEVRFVVAGRGLFHVNPERGPVFSIEMFAGDLICVPAGTRHWFNLCSEKRIRTIRLFKDQAGWIPSYIENSLHLEYEPDVDPII